MQTCLFLFIKIAIVTAQFGYPSPKCEDDIYGLHQSLHKYCMTHGGIERCWWIPPVKSLNSVAKVPLVVELHGYTGCAEWMGYTGFAALANTSDFIVVWPQGTYDLSDAIDNTSSWNVSDEGQRCFGGAAQLGIDDVGFLTELIKKLSTELPVDTSRVYMAGHSNGCAMAQMMASKKSRIVAGVACHALYSLASSSPDYVPTSIMEIHGMADKIVSYENFSSCKNTSAELNAEYWKNLNNCNQKTMHTFEHYNKTVYTNCDDGTEVVLISLPNVGHTPYLWNSSSLVDTTAMAWEFLKRFQKKQKVIHESSHEVVSSNTEVVSSSTEVSPDDSSVRPNANIIFPGLMMIICLAINLPSTK